MSKVLFTLRRCEPGDEATLALVGGASFLDAFAETLDGTDLLAHCTKNHSAESYAKYLSQPTTRAYVAELLPGKAAVGYILMCEPDLPLPDLSAADYELKRIYLLHRFQGTGIGRALMQQAIETTREIGRKRLLLGVYDQNFDAIEFYRKAGFDEVGERLFQVGSAIHHDAIMARIVD